MVRERAVQKAKLLEHQPGLIFEAFDLELEVCFLEVACSYAKLCFAARTQQPVLVLDVVLEQHT